MNSNQLPCGCYIFIERPPVSSLSASISLKPNRHKRQKDGADTSYCKPVSIPPKVYARDDAIVEAEADLMHFHCQTICLPIRRNIVEQGTTML